MAHREVMERAARGPRTALPSQWLLRNTRSGKNGARKSCMRGKLVENRELRDAIDRAAGRVAYLREVAAFEAGYGFMPE